jgi:hypothetical protein
VRFRAFDSIEKEWEVEEEEEEEEEQAEEKKRKAKAIADEKAMHVIRRRETKRMVVEACL